MMATDCALVNNALLRSRDDALIAPHGMPLLQVGGFDPLLDDSVDFNTRIRRLGVPGELHIHRTLPHTFFSFPICHAIPEVQQAMAVSTSWLEDVFAHGEATAAAAHERSSERPSHPYPAQAVETTGPHPSWRE